MDAKRTGADKPNRMPTYDPDEHDQGEWLREQISDDEWNDYDWTKVEGFGRPTKYVRGFKRR
jgi:hypothetical protein